ncbi:hypothetical protein N7462_006171 [Penicillium macrosclerotiorum]|uniref:uncharacterized protein n=1 Tax=Penicillium macrosclerotiorum TaxID=303699 RepID=UPI002547D78F|nr:uncharacterized protein N7462_006171 [Penicillium macrosclerotiorum]KAJ5683006.1 hypothetical protein N7462_006171 [Penicillium macrosclerotiorum]
MKAPEEITKAQGSSNDTNGIAGPRKRRPPKLAKRTTPSDGQSEGSQQRQNGSSDISNSNYFSEVPNGMPQQERQPLDTPSQAQTPEKPQASPRSAVRRQRTTVRRNSAQSTEPDQAEVITQEQRPDSSGLQKRETRVRRMLSPEVQNQEVVSASDPHPGRWEEPLPNSTNSTARQVVETTEAVQSEKGKDQLKLRLDLNLDVEIELKAKIRGDLTLQLLQ